MISAAATGSGCSTGSSTSAQPSRRRARAGRTSCSTARSAGLQSSATSCVAAWRKGHGPMIAPGAAPRQEGIYRKNIQVRRAQPSIASNENMDRGRVVVPGGLVDLLERINGHGDRVSAPLRVLTSQSAVTSTSSPGGRGGVWTARSSRSMSSPSRPRTQKRVTVSSACAPPTRAVDAGVADWVRFEVAPGNGLLGHRLRSGRDVRPPARHGRPAGDGQAHPPRTQAGRHLAGR